MILESTFGHLTSGIMSGSLCEEATGRFLDAVLDIITKETSLPGIEAPIHYWVPSIAPSGMTFVTSDSYPGWKNNLLACSLKFQYLDLLIIENNKVKKEEKLLSGLGRVRNVTIGPDGLIYVSIEHHGIIRIVPV